MVAVLSHTSQYSSLLLLLVLRKVALSIGACLSFPPQAVTNLVAYKFNNLPQAEWQMMYDLAKMFLYCFNHWKLETPSAHTRSSPNDDQRAYRENHAR